MRCSHYSYALQWQAAPIFPLLLFATKHIHCGICHSCYQALLSNCCPPIPPTAPRPLPLPPFFNSPEPRVFHAAAAVGHRVYVYGGHVLHFDAAHGKKKRAFFSDVYVLDTVGVQREYAHEQRMGRACPVYKACCKSHLWFFHCVGPCLLNLSACPFLWPCVALLIKSF